MSKILTSLHGRQAGLDSDRKLVVPSGFRAGNDGSQIDLPSPAVATLFDDFAGAGVAYSTTIVDGWRSRKGSDAACVDWTVTPAENGTVVGTIGSTTASMAVSGVQLDAGLSWKASAGGLTFETRLKLSTIANVCVFAGFTDQTSALEMPFNASGASTMVSTCSNGCGILYDTTYTSAENWLGVGVKGDTDSTIVDVGYAPAAATYYTLRVEIGDDEVARFYVDGILYGSASAAVTKTVALTPVIAGFNKTTTGTPTITVDYVHVSAARV